MRRIAYLAVLGAALAAPAALAQSDEGVEFDPPDTEYRTGAILVPEAKHRSFQATPTYRAYLPASVDLAPSLPLPGNQGRQGSCTSWAVGYAVRAYYTRAYEGRNNRRSENIPSPAYIHNSIRREYFSKRLNRYLPCGAGAIHDALELLKVGALSLRRYPYRERACPAPSASEQAEATRFRIEQWFRVDTSRLDQVKAELAQGHPVVFASNLARSFDRFRGATVYRRRPGEGDGPDGHAVAIIGYDERRQAVRIINSWGRGWGDRGYAWLSYDEVRGRRAYVMRPAKAAPPEPPTPPLPPPPSPGHLIVSDLPCAKVSVSAAGGRTRVTGFVGKVEQIETIRQRLQGRDADIDVAVRPWPQCETLLTLDAALAAADRPAVRLLAPRTELQRGEAMGIEVTAPREPAHVHVAYIQADGSVVHLVQADADNLRTVDRGAVLTFGDGQAGRARFTVGPPFGPEMVIALASRSPLFEVPRPQNETEREFLTALRRALALREGRPEHGGSSGGVRASFVTLTTMERPK